MKEAPTILSFIYQDRINKLCDNLYRLCHLKYFVCYIVFSNGQTFVLSNMYHMLVAYYTDDWYKQDFNFKRENTADVTHYLCDRSVSITKQFAEILEEKFKIFRAYYIVRNCPECQFIFGAIKDHPFDDYERLYKTTLNKFEEFCCHFIDNTIDIIKCYNPSYYSSIVLNDLSYRKSIIKSNGRNNEKLTIREIDCLHWAAHGKSSEETGLILGISKTTVESYRNEIKRKLNSVNIAQAVFEGVKYGYIGAFNKNWNRTDNVSINGVYLPNSFADKNKELSRSNLWLLNNKNVNQR